MSFGGVEGGVNLDDAEDGVLFFDPTVAAPPKRTPEDERLSCIMHQLDATASAPVLEVRARTRVRARREKRPRPDASLTGEWVADYVLAAHRTKPEAIFLVPDVDNTVRDTLLETDYYQMHLFSYRDTPPLVPRKYVSKRRPLTPPDAPVAEPDVDGGADVPAAPLPIHFRVMTRQLQTLFGVRNTGINWDMPCMGGSDVDARTTFWRTKTARHDVPPEDGRVAPTWELRRNCTYSVKTTAQMELFVDAFQTQSSGTIKHLSRANAPARRFVVACTDAMSGRTSDITCTDAARVLSLYADC